MIGGRLDYLNGREVAALVYRKNKHIINVFVWPAVSEVSASPQLFSKNGYNLINWSRDGFDWWAVSDVNAADLEALVDLERRG